MLDKGCLRRLTTSFLVYGLASGVALATTRFDGGVAFLWVATAYLVARLLTAPRGSWLCILVGSGFASMAATALLGLGFEAAPPLGVVNVGEALIAALLLRRWRAFGGPLGSLSWLAKFVFATGVVAPLAGSVPGAMVAHMTVGAPWLASAMRWYAGHALGSLTFTPIAVLVLRGDVRRWLRESTRRRIFEALLLLAVVAACSVGVFAQSTLPLLFLPMLPIMLSTFRFGRLGAAASVVLLALVGGGFTLAGRGPAALIDADLGTKLQFFQLYLAATVLTVLPIAADLSRRASLFRSLRDSEARYRVLAETSTDIILNLDVDGRIRFVSPSVRQLGGYEPEDLLGRNAALLVSPEHRPLVEEAHRRTIGAGGEPSVTEYLALTKSGEWRWFETRARAIVTEEGEVDGVVSVVRDIGERKGLELRLAADALTDPLTGLPNRRAFSELLERQGVGTGCVAMLDIDHFKSVNDRWGHAAGDEVLRSFAKVARRTIRAEDHIARLGGEEFAILLPNVTLEQAELICDRLRCAVAESVVPMDGAAIRITLSGGVAPLSGATGSVLESADRALYEAKRTGRNRLVLA
ncbi:sensor domain-containing diguanylate cyclase [Sphingomonas sp. BK580]|uniref:sensor domain-containing diguanylate cyclase n=1 Tax=Sphingomonas sp. BK580 TaxID=2586972 RepID=UPI00160E36D6|nr:sensor domain-containing diguanylate cyclase [Sphingomonas sp. BK580]MBB3695257.1 diguanylate cyclase (GGDEF)-like protein/PAS domain S-box-containing protein [Sphingomonas sp. BK580]